MLEDVGLADRARDKFRTYSLGMKQRLAIAATLLKDPNLLIFDEPTNGLDPAGIHEIRATMRSLAAQGKTVLVSSHILSEVQQVADTVTIIGRGRLLAEGTVAEILDAAGEQQARVGVSDPAQAAAILSAAGFVVSASGRELNVGAGNGHLEPSEITRVLAERGLLRRGAGAHPPEPGVGIPRADRRRAPGRHHSDCTQSAGPTGERAVMSPRGTTPLNPRKRERWSG